MLPDAHSPEFARLATRWLDGVASADEAARFWRCVGESPECARVFAEMARFELLLESTSAEIAREALVAVAASEKNHTHRRRALVTQSLKIAAVVTFLGAVIWALWPEGNESPVAVVPPPAPASAKGQRIVTHDRVLLTPSLPVSPPATPAVATAPAKPLPKHLDEFFLTSVSFDKLPLREAIQQMEAQLRALNFARSASLDRLRVTLPAEATGREVTFHSGAISFLKAVRAVAALAGCDVTVSDVGVALNSRIDGNRPAEQQRTTQSLLAADGIGLHTDLSELIEDARALGMIAGDDATGISGTEAQFEALAQLAEARRQIRMMPEFQLLAYLVPANPNDQSRVLTPEEAKAQAAKAGSGVPITLKPTMTAPAPKAGEGPDLILSAVPAGDGGRQIRVEERPRSQADPVPMPLLISQALPTDALMPTGGAVSLPFLGQQRLGSSLPSNQQVGGGSGQGGTLAMADTGTSRSAPVTENTFVGNGGTLQLRGGTLTFGSSNTSPSASSIPQGTLALDSLPASGSYNLMFSTAATVTAKTPGN